jgi:hypothetical protein
MTYIKTHCRKGHLYGPEDYDKKGRRYCKPCHTAARVAWTKAHPEIHKNWRTYHFYYRYKITVAQYEQLLAHQNGVCAICRKPPVVGEPLVVDHDHKTEEVRGLLHKQCNIGVGGFDDNPVICRLAAEYLENPPAKGVL